MSRRKKTNKPFYMLFKEMVDSQAWKELSPYDIKVFIHIAIKSKPTNRDNLSLTYREIKMSTARFRKSIISLVEKGFIDIIRSGGRWKRCNIYALSERWRRFGMDDFIKGETRVIDPNFNPTGLILNSPENSFSTSRGDAYMSSRGDAYKEK